MTTTTTTTVRPVPGQTWKRVGYGFRHVVLDIITVSGEEYVVFKAAGLGSRPSITSLDEFLAGHEAPEWPTPEPVERTTYSIVTYADGGDRGLIGPYETRSQARRYAAEFPATTVVAGIVRASTVTTYEWVTEDGAE